MVAIGSVKIADLIGRIAIRRGANLPFDIRDRPIGAGKFDTRRAKEGHREVTAQIDAVRAVADHHGEGLDEILAVVAVVENARAIEKPNGSVNRGRAAAVPGDAQADFGEGRRPVARDRELERPDHRGAVRGGPNRGRSVGGHFNSAGLLANAARAGRREAVHLC